MHPAALPLEELERQCDVTRTRRSGPGGQHRNKVETAIVIVHRPSGLRAEASERRSQSENLAVAWQRLRVVLALGVRRPWVNDRLPLPLWHERARGGKISINPDHADFGPLLADVLDRLAAVDWEPAAVAESLGVSNSQLVKFLKLESRALQQLNDARSERGLRPLH
jgi:hypothetical protein